MSKPYTADLKQTVKDNDNFRQVLFTGAQSQLVAMSIEPGDDIGLETHDQVDQVLYAVEGDGTAMVAGKKVPFEKGSVVCVPAGTEHNVLNDGDEVLKLFTVYAPPQHEPGAIERFKAAKASPV